MKAIGHTHACASRGGGVRANVILECKFLSKNGHRALRTSDHSRCSVRNQFSVRQQMVHEAVCLVVDHFNGVVDPSAHSAGRGRVHG
jgi:hypothetical protein